MSRITTTNNLVMEQRGNLSGALLQFQHSDKTYNQGANTPEFKMALVYSAEQKVEKTKKSDTKLWVRNMVSIPCIMVVKAVLEYHGLKNTIVEMGSVETAENISEEKRQEIKADLLRFGLELMDDRKTLVVERIKNAIVEMIYSAKELPRIKISVYISQKFNHNYTFLSNVFSEVMGITLEQYVINQKIERVKQLISYGEFNLTEIAYKLNYSSVAHLSNQFKKVTGLTPSYYKMMKETRQTDLV